MNGLLERHYLGLSVITPVLPLAPSQMNVSRKLPRVHARKYIAIKLFRNIPITLTMMPHLIETAQSGVREWGKGRKEGDENSKPPSQSIVLLKQNHCISQGNRHLIPTPP